MNGLLLTFYSSVIEVVLVFIFYRAIKGLPPPPPLVSRIALPYRGGLFSGAALENFLTTYAQLSKLSNQNVCGQEPTPSLAV